MLLRYWVTLVVLAALTFSSLASGHELEGHATDQSIAWYTGKHWSAGTSLPMYLQTLTPQKKFSLTGGEQISVLKFKTQVADEYVIDFRNSTLVGEYKHLLFDRNDKLVTLRQGGMLRTEPSEYFLRNGQNIRLGQGQYTLITYQTSQFNIAPPTPFIIEKSKYISQLRVGNSITLIGLGILTALFFYYLVLSMVRASLIDLTYALFILGNLLFNSTSLLVAADLFGLRWFGGASWPILFSNIAYIVFVMSLLQVSRTKNAILWYIGVGILTVFTSVLIASIWFPHYQNEFNRLSVGVFLLYGITVGLRFSFQGRTIAQLYLLANVGFVILGGIAISQEQIQGLQTIYMSHIGLLAVVCEVLLLSFVIAYQMVILEADKSRALKQAKEMLSIAQTDPLTRLPNRYAMEKHLLEVGKQNSFIYIDLDGLKLCNDSYGHDMGDKLLRLFSQKMLAALPNRCRLYRISGDEFGIIFDNDLEQLVVEAIYHIESELKLIFDVHVGVSFGRAKFGEYLQYHQAIQAADEDMYSNKKRKKAVTS